MNKLKTIYNKLFSHSHPQHRWHVTKEGELAPKYHKNIELNEKQKLEICFGAVLARYIANHKNILI